MLPSLRVCGMLAEVEARQNQDDYKLSIPSLSLETWILKVTPKETPDQ